MFKIKNSMLNVRYRSLKKSISNFENVKKAPKKNG